MFDVRKSGEIELNEKLIETGEFIHKSLLNGSSKTNPAFDEAMLLFVCNSLAILKEQETVPVKEDKINKCKCGETVCRYWHPEFCGFCGRKLLWY